MGSKVGKDDPCPCGSGKKYRHCCMGRDEEAQRRGGGAFDLFVDLRGQLAGRQFATQAEAHAFVQSYMERQSRMALDDFHGLSPDEMHRFLHAPFDSPDLVTFADRVDASVRDVPFLVLFSHLVEGLGEKGMKTTAKGNLLRNFCREVAQDVMGEEEFAHFTRISNINREEDYLDFHVTRVVAELSRIVRKTGNRFVVSATARKAIARSGVVGLYPGLLRVYCRDFNWGYWDGGDELAIIQRSFLFTLYLLTLYGDEWRPQTFYEDCFIRAFPMVLNEVQDRPWTTPEKEVRSCFTSRALEYFAEFFGLAELERDSGRLVTHYRVRKGPMLERAVKFHAGRFRS